MKRKFHSQLKAVLSAAGLLAIATATLSLNAHAAAKEGGGSTGGGNAVGNVLFDFYENKGSLKIDPRELPVWESHVKQVLEHVAALVPDFVPYLEQGITQKKWYLEPKPLSETGCLNRSIVRVGRKIVGCQNVVDVRLYKSWFESRQVNAEDLAGLIVHELLVFHVLQNIDRQEAGPTEFHARDLVRTFFFENPSAEELRSQIQAYRFGTFMTAEEKARVEADKRAFNDGVCEARDPAGVTYDRYDALLEAIGARKGSSEAEWETRRKLAISLRSMFFGAPLGNFAEGCEALRQSH